MNKHFKVQFYININLENIKEDLLLQEMENKPEWALYNKKQIKKE